MTDSEQNYPHFSTKFWMPNGQLVFFTIPISNPATAFESALRFTNMMLEQGALQNEPGLGTGEQRELIVTVMRRAKPSDDTPIIDFYTEWGDGGDEPWGTYKYLHIYMDSETTTAFLKVSGLQSLEQIPLYDAQSPLKRIHGKRHNKEVDVPTPFYVVKKQGSEKMGSDGKPYKPWEFVRFESVAQQPTSAPQQPQRAPQPAAPVSTPQVGEKRTFMVDRIETEKTTDGKVFYSLMADTGEFVLTFSRDLFRVWGLTDDDLVLLAEPGTVHDIKAHGVEAKLIARKDGSGTYWAAIIPEKPATPKKSKPAAEPAPIPASEIPF